MILFLGVTSALTLGCMAAVLLESKESRLAHATNDLAFDLLRAYKNEKNPFISPFSISTALALVYLGADGATEQAMKRVLKYDQYELTPEEINQGFQSLLSRIKDHSVDYQLSSYNSAQVQKDSTILKSYKQPLEQYYSAIIENVDFASQGEQVKERINAAVGNATNGKVTELLEQPPSPDTKLFILNAVYFFGSWKTQFDTSDTHESLFYDNNGIEEKKIEMMARYGSYRYTKSHDLKATVVVIPYGGYNSANFIVALPDSKTGVAELEEVLTQASLNEALRNASAGRIDLFVPKFNLSFAADMKQALFSLGLGELFGNNANLSRIAGPESGLKVSSVIHKAVIEVNENGSEAAAATGIEFIPASLTPTIRINHPFLFFIQESESGMILFAGRVDEL